MDERMRKAADETRERVEQSHERAEEHLQNAIETEKRVISQNEMLKDVNPDRRDVYDQRIAEGKKFLGNAEQALTDLERGGPTGADSASED